MKDLGGTDLRCGINGAPADQVNQLKIVLGGDAECEALLQGLEFALHTLRLLQCAADAWSINRVEDDEDEESEAFDEAEEEAEEEPEEEAAYTRTLGRARAGGRGRETQGYRSDAMDARRRRR